MNFSVSAIFSLSFWGTILLLFLYVICQTASVFQKTDCRYVIWMSEIAFLRFLLPIRGKFEIHLAVINILQADTISLSGRTFSLFQIFLFLWLSVTILLSVRLTWKYVRFRLAIKTFLNSGAVAPVTAFSHLLPPKLKVCESTAISIPMLTGLLKPVILLPKIPLAKDELTLILSHELQHYRYKDIFQKICIELFCILYWWNPAIRIFKKQMLLLMEIRADLNVYDKLNEIKKIEYLRCLQLLSGYRTLNPAYGIHFAEGRKSFLLQRVKYLIAENRQHKPPVILILLFSFLLALSFLFTWKAV